jgi:anti-anti-sigma factor
VEDAPDATAITVENGRAIVARPQVKMLDERALRSLTQSLDAASAANAGVRLVVLDLSRVAVLPSLALGSLLQIGSQCAARRQTLKLAAVQPQIRKVLSMTRLDEVFQIADSVDTAMH